MKKLLSLLTLTAVCIAGNAVSVASAQSTDICSSAPFMSTIKVPIGTYDVYVKNTEQTALSGYELAVQNIDSNTCRPLAREVLSGSVFTKVASYTQRSDEVVSFYLGAMDIDSNQSTVEMYIVPKESIPCDLLGTACQVVYEGSTMELSPKKLSYSSDNLRVGLLMPIDSAQLKRVVYAIDGKKVYEKNQLEQFDERYVSGGEHTVTRRVFFSNGQTLSGTTIIKRGTSADILYTFQAYYFRSSELLKIVGVFLLVVGVFALTRTVVRHIAKKRIYKQTHTVGVGWSIPSSKVGAQKNFYDESIPRVLYRYRKIWGSFLVVCVLVLASSYYLVSVFTVDGLSMYPTLTDRSKKILIRAPRTLAGIARNDYVPKRGTIVVINKSEENLFSEDLAVTEANYVVKRVVGLPQDRVVVKGGVIRIFNTENPKGFVPDDTYKWISDLTGSEYFSIDIILKDGEVFVVGDNRDESIDSRFYGAVDVSKIIGSVIK